MMLHMSREMHKDKAYIILSSMGGANIYEIRATVFDLFHGSVSSYKFTTEEILVYGKTRNMYFKYFTTYQDMITDTTKHIFTSKERADIFLKISEG